MPIDTKLGAAIGVCRKKAGFTSGPEDLSYYPRRWNFAKNRILIYGPTAQPGVDGGFTHIVMEVMKEYSRPAYFCATGYPERITQLRILPSLPRHIWLGCYVTSDCELERLRAFRKRGHKVDFLLVCPSSNFLPDLDVSDVEWVVVEGYTTKYPYNDWARSLCRRCEGMGIPICLQDLEGTGDEPIRQVPKYKKVKGRLSKYW